MYQLEKLQYGFDELEPFIDTHTLGLHYNKHAKNYLNKLNQLLIDCNYQFNYSLEELSTHIKDFKKENIDDILFNLGGVINHNIYFKSINPDGEEPNIFLKMQIGEDFGGLEKFKLKFKDMALNLKGSGYTFLVLDNGKLKIVNLKNQDNPYNYGYMPLLCIDMWEHAYYINYENRKDNYIDNFFEIIDFRYANKVFYKLNS